MSSVLTPASSPATAPNGDLASRHEKLNHFYDLSVSNPLLERQRTRESNARSYPRRIPLALARGQGIYVEDTEGRVFIDCLAGAGTPPWHRPSVPH